MIEQFIFMMAAAFLGSLIGVGISAYYIRNSIKSTQDEVAGMDMQEAMGEVQEMFGELGDMDEEETTEDN